MYSLSPLFEVPANSSRYFENYFDALRQPKGRIHLVWDEENRIIVNKDYAPALIKYDSQYCTTVSALGMNYTIPTLSYIHQILNQISGSPIVIDIGCGQGEFVLALRDIGIDAWGFDPVVRNRSQFLEKKYWEPADRAGDLYVLRCVLPHIENPWEFLSQIWISSPHASVLIEFQRAEWALEHRLWYQISHDHVNYFSIKDFSERYEVKSSGQFSNGEWGWVLIAPKERLKSDTKLSNSFKTQFIELFNQKEVFLEKISKLSNPVAIWGAAGKGIVLAYSLSQVRNQLIAVDADINRWGRYLEASGTPVISPKSAMEQVQPGTLILVCNPNHINEVKDYVQDKFEVKLPRELDDI